MTYLSCLRALRAYVPTYLTCLCALRAYVPSCFKSLGAYVPFVPTCLTCLRVCVPSFFTCLRAYMRIYIFHAYVPLCLKLFRTYLRSFFTSLGSYNHSQNILRFIFISCIAAFSRIIWRFIPFKTPKQTPASKTAYPNPILWGFLSRPLHPQKQWFKDSLRSYLKQWTLSSILNS